MNTNTKKRVWTFLMALAMIVTLAACGGSSNSPAGMYELSKMGDDSMEMTVEELSEIYGTEIGSTLELAEDNTFTWDIGLIAGEEGDVYSGTWELDGDSLALNIEGEEAACTYDGKTIVIDMEDVILTYEKQ